MCWSRISQSSLRLRLPEKRAPRPKIPFPCYRSSQASAARVELYGTVSQAYRPITYGEVVPTGASSVVNGDLKEGKALQFEFGVRGKPLPYLNFDVGGFYFTFTDQIGEVILPNGFTSTENVGDARYMGFEAATELDVLALINGGVPSPYGNLKLYGNVTLLDAEFTSGPNTGNTPAYAPNYQVKTGAIYSYKNTFKLALLGTLVDDEFGDATIASKRYPSLQCLGPDGGIEILERASWSFRRYQQSFSTRIIGAKSARKAS